MTNLLSGIKMTKSGNVDKFFGFGFNMRNNRIYGTRGFIQNPRQEFTDHDYQNKLTGLRKAIA
jgi:hypothetical protein